MATIPVPEQLGDKDLNSFFKGWSWRNYSANEVIFDFSRTDFISPWAVTLFASYALKLKAEDKIVRLWIDDTRRVGRFLIQSGIYNLLDINSPISNVTQSDKVVPLTNIRSSSEIPGFTKNVMALLQIEDEEIEGAVEYSFVELLRNVVQHSHSPIGGLAMAAFFPSTGLVELAVADCGVGIMSSLSASYPEINEDRLALKFAMMPHVSGTFTQAAYGSMLNNAGLGLFFVKEIATRSAGGFFLGSNSMLADLWGNANGTPGQKYIQTKNSGWPGTFAFLQLRKTHIADFASLLAHCRDLAAKARKDPREFSLDFIDEIPDIEGLVQINVSEFNEDVEMAAALRDTVIIPALNRKDLVVWNFDGIRFATQSFVHACMYKILRDISYSKSYMSFAMCSNATKEAIKAVAYAESGNPSE